MSQKILLTGLFLTISLVLLSIFGIYAPQSNQLAAPPTPYWGSNKIWSVVVTETFNGTKFNFTYYYDWTKKLERYEYGVGEIEGMCRSAGFPDWSGKQCNSVFTPDGWWYVEFPKDNFCCKCIDTYGPIRYDWLQANSTYKGQESHFGMTTDCWLKKGNMAVNQFCVTANSDQLPVFFRENFTAPNYKEWDFNLRTFSTGPIDPAKFQKPANCDTRCGGYCPNINPRGFMHQIFNSLKVEE